jgi:hypothetical protein
MLEHHEEELWAGVSAGHVTAIGGCVIDPACSARVGAVGAIGAAAFAGVLLHQILDPSPLGAAAQELGVNRYKDD